jgi:hypothetical protein
LLNAKLAWILATCKDEHLRDGERAMRLARTAVESSGGDHAGAWEALAAAQAATGDLPEAVDTLEQALTNEDLHISQSARERMQVQLDGYRQGRLKGE